MKMQKNYINQNIINAINDLKINVYRLKVLSTLNSIVFGFDKNSVFEEFEKSYPDRKIIEIKKIDTFIFKDKANRVYPVSEAYENLENNYLIYDGLYSDKTKEVAIKIRDIFVNEFLKKSA